MNLHKKLYFLGAIVIMIGGCQGRAPMADQAGASSSVLELAMDRKLQQPASPPSQRASASPTVDLSAALKKDMAYADLRKLVVAAGWSPVVDPQCEKNVSDGSAICEHLPEVESCSGDGYCVMHFERVDNRERMDVTTYGMVEDWNVSGEESRLNVVDWIFSNAGNG